MLRGLAVVTAVAVALGVVTAPAGAEGDRRGTIVFSVAMPDGIGRGGDGWSAQVQSQVDGQWDDPESTECYPRTDTRCTLSLPPGRYRIGVEPSSAYDGSSALEEWFGGVHPIAQLQDQYLEDARIIDVPADTVTDLGTMQLDLEGTISGSWSGNAPRVSVRSPRGPWVELTTETSDNIARGMPPGDYRLSFPGSGGQAFGYWGTDGISEVPPSFHLDLGEDRTDMDVRRQEPGTIRADIALPDGRPADVAFSLYFRQGDAWVRPPERLYSNPTGTWSGLVSIEGLAPGDYRLVLERRAGAERVDVADETYPGADTIDAGADIRVTAGRTTSLTHVLRAGGHLTGRVVGPDGAPLARLVVAAVADVRGVTTDVSTAITDANGRYDIDSLGTRGYRVRAGSPRAFRQENQVTYAGGATSLETADPVEASAGTTREVPDIVAALNGSSSGRVVDEAGAPVGGIGIMSTPFGSDTIDAYTLSTTTDADGRWSLPRAASGPYQLRITDGSRTYREGIFDGTTTIDTWVPPLAQRASIDLSPTASPFVTITVRPRPPDIAGWTITNGSHPGYAPPVRVGDALTLSDLTFTPRTAVAGPVQWLRDGVPIAGATAVRYVVVPQDAGRRLEPRASATSLGLTTTRTLATYVVEGVPVPEMPVPRAGLSDTTPVVGQVLGTVTSRPPTGFQWLRDGRAIKAATSGRYRVSKADHGARLSVRVRMAGTGYLTTGAARPVRKARPTLAVSTTSSRRGRVVIDVRATAPGVSASVFASRVRISRVKPGSDAVTTVRMRKGRLVMTLKGQPSGRRTYYVTMLGVRDRLSTTHSRTVSVRVR